MSNRLLYDVVIFSCLTALEPQVVLSSEQDYCGL